MKVYLVKTVNDSPKYDILYKSISQMFNTHNSFEIVGDINRVDCIISIGDLTSEITLKKQSSKIVIVRFLFRSDISKFFYTDERLVDYTFWVKDLDINILYPYLQTSTKIEVPFDFYCTKENKDEYNKYDIYVNTGEFLYADSALLKIIRTLNRLTQYKIDVCSKNANLRNVLNSNISISDSTNLIEQHVKQSKMVIGSGYVILYAIKYNKPFIVIGERGYGGIPTEKNIYQYYQEFFQGTIGGRLDGALPENLVYEDIKNIEQQGFVLSKSIVSILTPIVNENAINIRKTLKNIINFFQSISIQKLQFNTDYTIMDGNGKKWLLNRYIRFIEAQIDNTYMSILKKYIQKESLVQLNEIPKEILEDLILHKILIQKDLDYPI